MRAWIATVAVGLATAASPAADWPQFRGPHGDGTAEAKNLPTTWGGFGTLAWQAEIPGRGWSSPIVVDGRIWLTHAEPTALTDKQRAERLDKSVYREFAEQFQAHASVTLYAAEFDAKTGEMLRNVELFTVENPPPIHATNTYASPTPVTDGFRLYCHFGPLGTCSYNFMTGQVGWKKRFAFDDITGPGSSPLLLHNQLIFACDGVDQQFVVALDKDDGSVLWRTPRPKVDAAEGKYRRAFSTPLWVSHGSREQVVIPGAQWVCSYDPGDGRELWRVNVGEGQHATIPRPVFQGGLVYVCTGYLKPQLWAIRVDGDGDVTGTHVSWKYDKQVPEISSPVIVGGEIYFVSALGVATCLNVRTGEQVWQHRLGGNYGASPLAADGKLYFTSQEGVTTVLKPGREYRELAKNQLFGQTLASLAICGESLLIRADRTLYCVRAPAP